ncbi:hypothetical protein [Pontibacter sp. G13]|uniref:hypothetical protein n=1 Tax=Pontibacter sp. G13 TaxID=3074898 RepID=UPI00288BB284|nr:hypothetical protein [Pontibacter sp. G13]WNJ18959.1 hypothetical protein RJD25_00590 [Pontibacter sp. G13]
MLFKIAQDSDGTAQVPQLISEGKWNEHFQSFFLGFQRTLDGNLSFSGTRCGNPALQFRDLPEELVDCLIMFVLPHHHIS